ncbi:MAG: 4Fe-4S dicluster domain-containing protein [Deltaproteobacteria bacterium]|nr:4Fe-4S dicluster domain-containing protein [Deltaproteobacteria bacterium]
MHARVGLRGTGSEVRQRIADLSGQNLHKCMQCGTCSAVCPMAPQMELTPRAAVAALQHGLAEQVTRSTTPWLCATCQICQARCPRGIELPRAMEALRLLRLRRGEDFMNPRAVAAQTLAAAPQIALVAAFRKLTS